MAISRAAQISGEFGGLARLYEGAGGIVGMHDQHGPGTRRERRAQGDEINLPAVIVEQRIRNQADVGKIGEKFEQRIAGRGNQNFIARFAQQPKNVAVSFAGSRGEQDVFRINSRDARSENPVRPRSNPATASRASSKPLLSGRYRARAGSASAARISCSG